MKRKHGFTLLEILLVIGIIAILASIVILALNPIKMFSQVRNTQRKANLAEINKALYQYYIDNSGYPSSVTTTLTEICNTGTGTTTHSVVCTGLVDLSALVPTYLVAIPADPQGSTLSLIPTAYAATNGTGYKVALDSSGKPYIKAVQAELSTVIEIGKTAGIVGLSWSGSPRYWVATTTSNWNSTASWSTTSGGIGGATVPGSGNDVIFSSNANGNCTLNAAVDIKGMFISGYAGTITQSTFAFTVGTDGYEQSSGTLTHTANGTTAQGEMYKVNITIAGNFTVDSGGTINVDGKGYAGSNGPGRSTNGAGTYGGMGQSAVSASTYGSIMAPVNLGSGASQDAGGGAVILVVSGITTVNGIISARGEGGGSRYHSGSGGSIFLTSGGLSGSGIIRTNGGGPTWGNGGGGGRVSVILNNGSDFGNVSITAYGGTSGHNIYGAAGTVYKQTQVQGAGNGDLIINNNNLTTTAGVVTSVNSSITNVPNGNITIQNRGQLYIETGVTFNPLANVVSLNTNSLLQVNSGGILNLTGGTIIGDNNNSIFKLSGGTFTTSATFSYTNINLWFSDVNSVFNPSTLFTIGSGALYTSDYAHTFSGSVTVASGGTITHTANGTTAQGEMYKVNLTIGGDLTVAGTINVNDKGYSAGNGPGGSTGNTGGSHGGLGAFSSGTLGTAYGSITSPINLGSGGGSNTGGGAVILSVTGLTTLSGTISANGRTTIGWYQGAGSGGSVYITTGTISGSGNVQANGGAGQLNGTSGGGGRVSIILSGTGADFSGFTSPTAYGIVGNYANSAAGTVYKQTQAQGTNGGTLIIDNNNVVTAAGAVTSISSLTTGTTVGTITLQNKGKLSINSGQTLTAQSTGTSLTINANSTLTNSGTLILGGTYVNNGTLTGYP